MSTTTKNITLDRIFSELQELRREVSLFLPAESLKDYKNTSHIKTAHRSALREYPLHGSRSVSVPIPPTFVLLCGKLTRHFGGKANVSETFFPKNMLLLNKFFDTIRA